MSKRGDPATRPAKTGEWQIRYATTDAAAGWMELFRQVPNALASLFDRLTADPRHVDNPSRQGRLKGQLGGVSVKDDSFEQWQYEITGGGRVWFAPDDGRRIVWITWASAGHPKLTE